MTGEYYLWYIPAVLDVPPQPLGIYDHSAPTGPIQSIRVPGGSVTRFLASATAWSRHVEQVLGTPYKLLKYLDLP